MNSARCFCHPPTIHSRGINQTGTPHENDIRSLDTLFCDKGGLEPIGGGKGSLIMIRALGNLQRWQRRLCWAITYSALPRGIKGRHWVYLHYFDQDKKDAESKGEVVWRCKIGSAGDFTKAGNPYCVKNRWGRASSSLSCRKSQPISISLTQVATYLFSLRSNSTPLECGTLICLFL